MNNNYIIKKNYINFEVKEKMTNKFQCFNHSTGNFNYFNYFYEIIINPTYLSNISIILGIIFLVTKNYSLIHSFMPILITNGLSILYYNLITKKSIFEQKNIKYMCNKNQKDQELLLSNFNNNTKIKGYIISIVIHFWLPLLIYILGRSNSILRDRKQSNIISSLLINCIFLSLYGMFMRKDQYILFDIDENKVSNFIFSIYVPILLVVTYLYFTL